MLYSTPLYQIRLVDDNRDYGITDPKLCENIRCIVDILLKWSSDSDDGPEKSDCSLAYRLAKLCKFCQDDHGDHIGGYVGFSIQKCFEDKEYHGFVVNYDPKFGYGCVYEDGDYEDLSEEDLNRMEVNPPFKWTCPKCTSINKCVSNYSGSTLSALLTGSRYSNNNLIPGDCDRPCHDCNHSSTKSNISIQ